ncbi:MAG: C13 family peptidase [Candidatus Competibacterales bacterium]
MQRLRTVPLLPVSLLLVSLAAANAPPAAVPDAPPAATLADGARYWGSLQGGRLEGEGVLLGLNGRHYRGSFLGGLFHGTGQLAEPDGTVYRGQFAQGLPQGWGRRQRGEDEVYLGQFAGGLPQGLGFQRFAHDEGYLGTFDRGYPQGYGLYWRGEAIYLGEMARGKPSGFGHWYFGPGDYYAGALHDGEFHGFGTYYTGEGDRYEGEFVAGAFQGEGRYLRVDGLEYRGTFHNWQLHGQGEVVDGAGNHWRGTFQNGMLHGQGSYHNSDGSYYRGAFRFNRYHGEGELVSAEGSRYRGAFADGERHGPGELTRPSTPDRAETLIVGRWERDVLVEQPDNPHFLPPATRLEAALYNQEALLNQALTEVAAGNPEEVELYFLGVAPTDSEMVFLREIEYIADKFDRLFGTEDRSLLLVNSLESYDRYPMATHTALRRALAHFAQQMDPDDILFLYFTSHGDPKQGISFARWGLRLEDLSPRELAELLDQSAIPWRVVTVSACYSGVFSEPLGNPQTLVITAAASDRVSFGCSNEAAFTYFGRAFFHDALDRRGHFIETFQRAVGLVKFREMLAGYPHSKPTLISDPAIEAQLAHWRRQREES